MNNFDPHGNQPAEAVHIPSQYLEDSQSNPFLAEGISSAPVAAQPQTSKSSSNAVTIVAVVVAVVATIAAVFFGVNGPQKLGLANPVPTRVAAIPEGFPADLSQQVPAGLASTLFLCESPSRINNGDVEDVTSGTNCKMAINGELGQAAFVADEQWIERGLDNRQELKGYKELDAEGFTAYSYTLAFSDGRKAHVVTLVSNDRKLYMDFVPAGQDLDFNVTSAEIEKFERYVLDAVAV